MKTIGFFSFLLKKIKKINQKIGTKKKENTKKQANQKTTKARKQRNNHNQQKAKTRKTQTPKRNVPPTETKKNFKRTKTQLTINELEKKMELKACESCF